MYFTIPLGHRLDGFLGKLNTISILCPALAQQSHSRAAMGKAYNYFGAPGSQNSRSTMTNRILIARNS